MRHWCALLVSTRTQKLHGHRACSGLDLRRMRNQRGLKPFQLARANGHSTIARQLCDTRSQARRARRRRNAGGGGGTPAKATTPEALLTMLIPVGLATGGLHPWWMQYNIEVSITLLTILSVHVFDVAIWTNLTAALPCTTMWSTV